MQDGLLDSINIKVIRFQKKLREYLKKAKIVDEKNRVINPRKLEIVINNCLMDYFRKRKRFNRNPKGVYSPSVNGQLRRLCNRCGGREYFRKNSGDWRCSTCDNSNKIWGVRK